jgi:4-hydroxy-tetrahydrodipicolinate synthase
VTDRLPAKDEQDSLPKMSNENFLPGVLAPVLTPFKRNLAPDTELYVRFCRWLHGKGVGLAIFGTNSEANSMSVEERCDLLAAVIAGGLPAGALLPGTGCCAIPDSVRLSAQAAKAGCAGVLMLPPFYYKPVSEDGLHAAYCEVVERVGDPRLKIMLYHIPQLSGVPILPGLIERLIKRYPDVFIGMKDSSGDFATMKSVIERFPGFKVYCGSERLLLATMRAGGAGCISATANVNPAAIAGLQRSWQEENAGSLQAELAEIRNIFEAYPTIAALKATVARFSGAESFGGVRPPLTRLTQDQADGLIESLRAKNFGMPGLAGMLRAESSVERAAAQ